MIIGAGPAGEAAAHKARELGATVAIVDRRWFGGSCPHIGCLPSKSLLDGAARHHANPAAYDWPRASAQRDYMINRPADARRTRRHGHVAALTEAGAVVYRGSGTIAGRGRVAVRHDGVTHELDGTNVVVAVGSVSKRPPIEGLDEVVDLDQPRRRRWPASCRAACSSSAAARPAASWPRSMPGSASRRRSSSPGRASRRPTTRATPRSCAPRSRRDGVTVRTGVRALRARAGGREGRRARHRARRRLDRRGPRRPARGRALVPDRRSRARALRHRHDRADAVPARRAAADRRRPVGHRRPGRAGAAHPPGALPGRDRGPDGARRGGRCPTTARCPGRPTPSPRRRRSG